MRTRDPLSDCLQQWRAPLPDTTGFNASVWRRIHETNTDESILVLPVLRPLPFAMAASITLLLAAVAGSSVAYAYGELTRDNRMAAAYTRSIDPIQKTSAEIAYAH